MNSPITIQYQILVVYNLTEISFQGCSANQTTIDVRLCEQLCCISCIYRSATYFKDYDQHLIFEGMNEPRQTGASYEWQGNAECYEVVNKLDNDFVETVRSIDSPYQNTRLLMIPSYAASAYASSYSALDVPDDDYVAVSLHAYTPYAFAMGDGDHTTFSGNYQSDLDTLFSDIRYYFTDKDIPVVLGEFSASNFNNTAARCDWATYYLTWTKKLGIPCVLWDNNAISSGTNRKTKPET